MPLKPTKKIWFNNELVSWESAQIHVLSYALHYGSAVFEGIRAYSTDNGSQIFRLNEHVRRLYNSAKIYRMNISYTEDEIIEACRKVVSVNELHSGAYIRPIAFRGYNDLALHASMDDDIEVAVAAWEWPSYMDPEAKEKGISIIKSSYEQYSNPLHSGYKIIGTYINSTMALHEAIEKGADEALLLDKNGYISEGSGENIFSVNKNVISTPKTDHCLNGITRQSVIQIARDLGFEVIEKDITYAELVSSDEVFFSGTAVEITPISKIDEITIGAGSIGSITEKLQTTYVDIVCGRNDKYKDWLSIVSE